MLLYFPDPLTMKDEEEIVALSDHLNTDLLLEAYDNGIYPWPHEEEGIIPWFCPALRGILDFEDFRQPKSFIKWQRNQAYHLEVKFQSHFHEILHHCAQIPRQGQEGSWITDQMISAYQELYQQGHILCCGVFDQEKLVAGLYGVYRKGIFSGESMFTFIPNASKLALYHLVMFLKEQNMTFIDTQMVTDVIKQFGGKEIPRQEFLYRLRQAQKQRK